MQCCLPIIVHLICCCEARRGQQQFGDLRMALRGRPMEGRPLVLLIGRVDHREAFRGEEHLAHIDVAFAGCPMQGRPPVLEVHCVDALEAFVCEEDLTTGHVTLACSVMERCAAVAAGGIPGLAPVWILGELPVTLGDVLGLLGRGLAALRLSACGGGRRSRGGAAALILHARGREALGAQDGPAATLMPRARGVVQGRAALGVHRVRQRELG
mmetsp:Transcript_138341/g.430107  ORF Transcript_138341/g.430107 Transcript_138341/m.430107 type:complete len:213 (+) Transcript_138341:1125-1763(+)